MSKSSLIFFIRKKNAHTKNEFILKLYTTRFLCKYNQLQMVSFTSCIRTIPIRVIRHFWPVLLACYHIAITVKYI